MPIESATFINQLNTANPEISDAYSTADDHIRLIKQCVRNSFSDIGSEVSASAGEINYLRGATSNLQTQIDTNTGLYNDIIGGTATAANALEWEGSTRFVSTATADVGQGSNGDLWFRYEE